MLLRASFAAGNLASVVEQMSSACAALKMVSTRSFSSLVSAWTEISRFPLLILPS